MAIVENLCTQNRLCTAVSAPHLVFTSVLKKTLNNDKNVLVHLKKPNVDENSRALENIVPLKSTGQSNVDENSCALEQIVCHWEI